MERRKAVIAAATASLTLLAGAAAISLNTGIVGASGDEGPGQISPVDVATTPPTTIYLDEPAAADQTTASGAPSLAPGASRSGDDDGYESESDEGENEDDRSPGDDYEYEYEGADDDD